MPRKKLVEGIRVELTYLSPCRNGEGSPNPYTGMVGVVHDLTDTTFSINTGNSWLVAIPIKKTKFIIHGT